MVIRVSDKKQNYNNVTKLLVKPKLIKILDPHSLNYNFENFYSLLSRKKGVSSPFFVVCLLYLQIKALFGILEQIFQVLR